MENEFEKTAIRVSLVSVVWNLILSVFKLIAGFVAHSGAMISDAVHFCIRCIQQYHRDDRRADFRKGIR